MSASDEARATVMDRIRSALGVASLDRARQTAVTRRLERHPQDAMAPTASLGVATRLTSASCLMSMSVNSATRSSPLRMARAGMVLRG